MREKLAAWVEKNVRAAHAVLITVMIVMQILTPSAVDLFLDLCALALVWRQVKDT